MGNISTMKILCTYNENYLTLNINNDCFNAFNLKCKHHKRVYKIWNDTRTVWAQHFLRHFIHQCVLDINHFVVGFSAKITTLFYIFCDKIFIISPSSEVNWPGMTLWPPNPSNSVTHIHSIFTTSHNHIISSLLFDTYILMSLAAKYIWGCETVMQLMDNLKTHHTHTNKQTSTYTLGQGSCF